MRLVHTIFAGALLLGITAPSWGQYPYRPYASPRYSPAPTWRQNYPSFGYGGYQRPGYGGYQTPRYGGYQPPGYGGYQAPGQAQGAEDDGRHVWVYSQAGNEGSFSDQGDGNWVESNWTGEYHFQEVNRTPRYVELFDPSRGAFVRITNRVMYSHGIGDPIWHRGYIGSWQ